MNPGVLTLLLRPAPGQRDVVVLPLAAFGMVTALVLTVIGGAQSFWTWTDDYAPLYQALALTALVLLVIPLMSLGGAAARLSARRRDERLSTLRLLGVTPGGVVIATVIESTGLAAIGALIGVLGHLLLSPLIALIPFRGEPLGLLAVIVSPPIMLAVIAAVVLLAGASAVVALRRVIVSPLGVRMRATASGAHWLRMAIALVIVGAGVGVAVIVPRIAGMVITMIALTGTFAAALGVLNLLGPWLLRVRAQRQLRRAETPERLLAARLVLDSPKAAWRQVGGIAMASFMAVFAGTGVSLLDVMAAPGAAAADLLIAADIRTGLLITLIGSFLMVSVSVAVNQASDVLDRRDLHSSLHRLGMPLTTVDRARRRAIMSPLLTTALTSALIAAILILPLMGIALVAAPLSVLTIAAVLAAGIGVVRFGTLTTKPLLARSFTAA